MTTTEEMEKLVLGKILDIFGDSQIVSFEYKFNTKTEKTSVYWVTEDQGDFFEHYYEFGWKK